MPASAGAAFASSFSFLGCCLPVQHSTHAKTMRRPVTALQAAERELSAGQRRLETYNTKELTSLLFAYGQLARWEVETKGKNGLRGLLAGWSQLPGWVHVEALAVKQLVK